MYSIYMYPSGSIICRRIETFLPRQKELWRDGNESIASQANKEKLQEIEKEQEVRLRDGGETHLYLDIFQVLILV